MDGRPSPFATRGGVALRRELLAGGYDDDEIRLMLRRGRWRRVRHGAYAEAELWDALDDVGRHLLRSRAALAALPAPAVLSHASAALALGLPVWGLDLDRVHVTRPGPGRTRSEAGVVHHAGRLPADQVCVVEGLTVTTPDRTVVDVARLGGFEPGVVTADAALREGRVTRERLLELAIATDDWPGSRSVGQVVSFADGLAETVGESRTRVLFHREGLPAPALQVEIRSGPRLLGRVDFLLEEFSTVVEFDGRVKYRRANPSGLSPEDVVWAEKLREDSIRGEGYEFARVVWSDLDRPAATAERIRATMARGLRLRRRPA